MPKLLTILTGASRGMGLAMAQQLLLNPDAVVLAIARNHTATLDACALQSGAQLLQWQADLAQADAVAARLHVWLGGLVAQDVAGARLINNAGVIPEIVPLRAVSAADLAHTLRVGLEAPMLLTAAFLRATQAWSVPRKVLNISSGLGRRPMASQAPYCAVKAGLDHFSRCLALDEALVPNGAKVCALAPGVIDTDMQIQLRSASAQAFPDRAAFVALQSNGQLRSTTQAAHSVLAYLERPDFGSDVVADVRQS
jgi:NAD(P)-dependent dehydrogenase (short-subunit alcohol dehydrogenase family)